MSQPIDGAIPPIAAAALPPALSAPLSAPPTAQTIITPSAATTTAAAAPAASPPPAPPASASAPLPAPAAASGAPPAAPNGLATQYGVVVWPSLPGLQQAAVGVAPPSVPSPHHIQGRGGMLGGAGMQQGLPAGAVPAGVQADWGAPVPTPTKGRRSKGRANSGKKAAANHEAREKTTILLSPCFVRWPFFFLRVLLLRTSVCCCVADV